MKRTALALTLILALLFLTIIIQQSTSLVTANSISSATAPSIEWEQKYSTGDVSLVRSMIQTSDGGYALAGMAMAIVHGAIGPWLVKVDSVGNKQWDKAFFDEKMNVNLGGANSIVQTSDGGYALAGGSYLFKADSQGSLQWRKNYSDVNTLSLVKTNDGGFVLAGSSGGNCWLAKVNSNGEIQWSHTYGGEKVSKGLPMSLIQTRGSGYALASIVNPSDSEYNALLINTDSSGNILWNRTYDSLGNFDVYSLVETKDEGYVLAGETNTFDSKGSFVSRLVSLIKTDSGGKVLWNQTYGELGNQAAWSVIETSDGGYALGCGWDSGSLVKTNSFGQLQWKIAFNTTVYSVVQTSDGEYVIAGGNGVGDNWLAKTTASTNNPSPSLSPSPTPLSAQEPFPSATVAAVSGAVVVVVVGAGLLVYFKKRKR
jgi:hypothetical protein